jgi:isopentenyl diphosphate isomerase/L-lactate dehydrogenase-like FMN-dependent dehydrogenase
MALRLKYAGIDAELAVDRDLGRSLDAAVADRDGGAPLFALPTYTALLELRAELQRRGHVGAFWSREPTGAGL